MPNKKDDILKKLIQKIELDKPMSNFTSSVMKEIAAEVQNEAVVNSALKTLLKRHGIEKPSVDFTNRVLGQLEEGVNVKMTYRPIISRKAWRVIATVAAIFVMLIGFSEQASTSPQGLTSYFTFVGNTLNIIFLKINTVPSLYSTTFISVSVLLFMDYFIRIKSQGREKGSRTLQQ